MRLAANDPVDALVLAGIESFEKGNAEGLAFALIRAGELGAQNSNLALGTHLLHLEGVSRELGYRAFVKLQQEADNTYEPLVHYTLAAILIDGAWGLPKNAAAAFAHLLKAEQLGMSEASLFLGVLCSQGGDTVRNKEDAKAWFAKAAECEFLFAKAQIVRMDESLGPLNRAWKLLAISVQSFLMALEDPSDRRLVYLNPKAKMFPEVMGGLSVRHHEKR